MHQQYWYTMSQTLKTKPTQLEDTNSVYKTVVFSEGQQIKNDFDMNRLVIQVQDCGSG